MSSEVIAVSREIGRTAKVMKLVAEILAFTLAPPPEAARQAQGKVIAGGRRRY